MSLLAEPALGFARTCRLLLSAARSCLRMWCYECERGVGGGGAAPPICKTSNRTAKPENQATRGPDNQGTGGPRGPHLSKPHLIGCPKTSLRAFSKDTANGPPPKKRTSGKPED